MYTCVEVTIAERWKAHTVWKWPWVFLKYPLPRFTYVTMLLQSNLIPTAFLQTWFKKSKEAYYNLWWLLCWEPTIFLCFPHVNFFKPVSNTKRSKKHLGYRYLFILLEEEACILYPSPKFSTSVSLELHRVIFSFIKGNFCLPIYIWKFDSCSFPSTFREAIRANKESTY